MLEVPEIPRRKRQFMFEFMFCCCCYMYMGIKLIWFKIVIPFATLNHLMFLHSVKSVINII